MLPRSAEPRPNSRRLPLDVLDLRSQAAHFPLTRRINPSPSKVSPSFATWTCRADSRYLAMPVPVRQLVRQKSLRRNAFWGSQLHSSDSTSVRFVLQVQVLSALTRIQVHLRNGDYWRRRTDSNRRCTFLRACSLSRGVPSTTRPRLRGTRAATLGAAAAV